MTGIYNSPLEWVFAQDAMSSERLWSENLNVTRDK